MRVKDQIIKRLQEGKSINAICDELGCSKGTVSYHRKQLGIGEEAHRRYNWVEIAAYQEAGHKFNECKTKFGFSASAWCEAVEKGLVAGRVAAPTDFLQKWSRRRNAGRVRQEVLARGLLEYRCYGENCPCSGPEWLGKPLILQLDHIDGDGTNNDPKNLRFLCPNCHSQTETWAFRNRSFYKNKYTPP